MLRYLGRSVLMLGVMAFLGGPAMAQRPGGGGGGYGLPFFLNSPAVQKDLKLSDEQVGKVQDTLREVREKHADDFAALRDLSQEERPRKRREMGKVMADEIKKSLALSTEQSQRFDQISLQQRAPEALGDPEVQDRLKLTDEQKEKLREIARSSRERMGEIGKSASGDRQEAMKKFAELRKDAMDKAMAVLTDDQKSTWKEMTGEPIEVRFERRRNNNNN